SLRREKESPVGDGRHGELVKVCSPLLLLFLISPSIDRQRPISTVPPGSGLSAYRSADGLTAEIDLDGGNRPSTVDLTGSGRSAYRSTAGPICTGRYGSYRSVCPISIQPKMRTPSTMDSCPLQ
ncbi:hypothetical protein BHM03_00024952, partial [Ensete ventricosum]